MEPSRDDFPVSTHELPIVLSMHRRHHFTSAIAIASCMALAVPGCRMRGTSPEAGAARIPAARAATVQQGDISRVLALAGQFQPYQVVDVHPKVSGYMSRINVDIGDVVHRGQTLAVLTVPELKAQVEAATFSMEQSKEELARAQHEIDRSQATYAALQSQWDRLKQAAASRPGLIAQQELDNAQAQALSAEAQVDASKAAMAAAKQRMGASSADMEREEAMAGYANVTSPLDGVVVWRYADTGALIQGGTNSNEQALPIVRIAQSGLLRLRVPVPEDDVRFVHAGDALQVRVDAIGRSFAGTVVRFTRNVSFETRTMETEIDVDNRDLSIAPGMYANTLLVLEDRKNVPTVPIDSLVLMAGGQCVYAIDDGNRIRIRAVRVGLRGQRLAEIAGGLKPGDRVVLGGQQNYREGERIDPLLTPEPASDTVHATGGTIDMNAAEPGNEKD